MPATTLLETWCGAAEVAARRFGRPAIPHPDQVEEWLRFGTPVLSALSLPGRIEGITPEMFAQWLSDWAAVITREPDAHPAALAVASKMASIPPATALHLAAGFLAGEAETVGDWAEGEGVSTPIALALWESAVQPLALRWGLALWGAPVSLWQRNACPVCASSPAFARIDGDNLRHLHCGLCGTSWPFQRLSCIWCTNTDPNQLQAWTEPSWDPWRVDTCRQCGGYWRTLDQRHGGLMGLKTGDLLSQVIRTRHLDVWAEQQGYYQGGRVA